MNEAGRAALPKVVVALDGSPAAATALPIARRVAAQIGASVEILHIAPGQAADPNLRRRLRVRLEEREMVQVRSRFGEPAAQILQAAAEPGVELVVLTTHGRTLEPGRRLARVAERVVAGAERPVLLVRPEAARTQQIPTPLRRLLVPLDGTPSTAGALGPATELASRLGASIDLVYVAGPNQAAPDEPGSLGVPCYVDQAHHEWPHWAAEVVDRLCRGVAGCPSHVPVQMFLAQGEIGEQITRFAAEHGDDAIVLVRRSRLQPGRARVLRAVLDQAPCPILLVGGPNT